MTSYTVPEFNFHVTIILFINIFHWSDILDTNGYLVFIYYDGINLVSLNYI